MNILQILAADKEVLIYRKELNSITKKVTATILLQQMIYWYTKMGGPFYKFIEPCKNKAYLEGDSWCEELGFSAKEFTTAYKILEDLGVVTKKIDMNRVTTYHLKVKEIAKLLNGVYGDTEMGVTKTPEGGLDIDLTLAKTTAETTQISEEEEDEGGCEVEIVVNTRSLPLLVVPAVMEYIPTSVIEQAIDRAVLKLAKKSPAGFRKSLHEGLKAGDPGWIETVFEYVKQVETAREAPWACEKRSKREQGEVGQHAFREAGFDNLLDYLENRNEEEGIK